MATNETFARIGRDRPDWRRLAAGWVLVRLSGSLLSRVLFDVTLGDLTSTATAIAVLLVASLLACIAPALRAMGVNPVDGLRVD